MTASSSRSRSQAYSIDAGVAVDGGRQRAAARSSVAGEVWLMAPQPASLEGCAERSERCGELLLSQIGLIPSPRRRWPEDAMIDPGSRPRQVPAGLERRGGLRLQAQEGPERGHRPRDVGASRTSPSGCATSGSPRSSASRRSPMAAWFANRMPELDFNDIYYYIKPTGEQVNDWDDLPDAIKDTYERLGIPEAERKYLAGVTAQYESEVVFHRNREDLERWGCCSPTWTRRCASTPSSSRSSSARSSRRTTTSSRPSTRPSGPAAPSSTSHRVSWWTSRCRPTSASTPRTWGSSSAR